MAFRISSTASFTIQLAGLSAFERRIVEDAVRAKLSERPRTSTNAVKQLRPNRFAPFELRIGDLRVLYNVVDEEVVLLALGRKIGGKLFVEGEEFHGHQDYTVEPPGNGSVGHAE